MSTRTIKTVIQLQRNTEAFFNAKTDFVPRKGEVVLVDTTEYGLRTKVGNGTSLYSALPFTDENLRDLISGIIAKGYYFNGVFYANEQHTIQIVAYSYKLYIDIPSNNAYVYSDEDKAYYKVNNIPFASSTEAGILKLYDETGSNTDGTMTQRSITDELGKKFIVSTTEDETIVFTN